jgi:hypothetical protein
MPTAYPRGPARVGPLDSTVGRCSWVRCLALQILTMLRRLAKSGRGGGWRRQVVGVAGVRSATASFDFVGANPHSSNTYLQPALLIATKLQVDLQPASSARRARHY